MGENDLGVVEVGGRFGCVGASSSKTYFHLRFTQHAAQFDELSCIIDFWRLVLALRPMSPQSSYVPQDFGAGPQGVRLVVLGVTRAGSETAQNNPKAAPDGPKTAPNGSRRLKMP